MKLIRILISGLVIDLLSLFSDERDYLSLLEPEESTWIPAATSEPVREERQKNNINIDSHQLASPATVDLSQAAVEERLEEDVDELIEDDVDELLEDEVRSPNVKREEMKRKYMVDVIGNSTGNIVGKKKEVEEESYRGEKKEVKKDTMGKEEEEHGIACDCLDCDDADFLHGFVDGEPFGIK